MQVAVGTYSGDGTDGRAITGIGFSPDLVIVKRSDSNTQPMWRSSAMSGDTSAFLGYDGANVPNRIESLDASGFTVGDAAEVNASGGSYHWWAFRDNGNGDLAVGSYTGDGTDDRSITGLGFQPDVVVVKADEARYAWWKPSSLAGDASVTFPSLGSYANIIQALESDGFQVGTTTEVNYSGWTYYWFAFKAISGICTVGSYTGNGTDDRSITGVGFQPDLVWVKGEDGGYGRARPSTLSGDLTTYLTGGATGSNAVQALESDGFQVGTHTDVNQNTKTYHWVAWKEGTAGGPTPKAGSDSLNLGEGLGDRMLGGADSVAGGDAVGTRSLAVSDAVGMAENAGVAEPKAAADSLALSEASSLMLGKSASDALAFGESASAVTISKIFDRLELQADVIPALVDRLELSATVFRDRLVDAVELQATVSPLLVDRVELEAAVRNQALEAASQAAVIAPEAEVGFL